MSDIKIGRMVLGACQTNSYFVYREGSSNAICVDPAVHGEKIYSALKRNGFDVVAIILTHGHFDHIWGIEGLVEEASKEGVNVSVYANAAEKELLNDAGMNVSAKVGKAYTVDADVYLQDGETFEIAGIQFKMIATPGHTAGGCCYYIEEAGVLLSGDTLFQESVGRTDLPTGSMGTLVRSIKDKLFALPGDTLVYPGHGDSTTIAYEKEYNPFLG